MLSKRIINLSINCRKLILTHKLKSAGSLCQVKTFTDRTKFSNKREREHRIRYKQSKLTSSSIVLDLLEFNFNDCNLKSSDTIETLTKLKQLCQQESRPPEKVVYEDFFEKLCNLINSQANDLSLSETLQMIDLLHKLRVSHSSKTVMLLLNRVDTLLNEASIQEYNRVMQVITEMPSLPLTEDIRDRLVKKFIIRICSEVDQSSFEYLIEAYTFACVYMRDKQMLKIVIDALENKNFDTESPQSILSLLINLTSANYYPIKCDNILTRAQNVFSNNIEQFSNEDILNVLTETSIKMNKNRLKQFYNKTLYDKIIHRLISTECSLDESLLCLKALNMARHTSKELLIYMSSGIYTEIVVNKKTVKDSILVNLLEGFADLKYKPFCWETFLNTFKTSELFKCGVEKSIHRVYHLACLDYYEPRILKRIFEKNLIIKNFNRATHHTLLQLYQKLKTIPDYKGSLPSDMQMKSFESLKRVVTDYPLYTYLKEALGGAEFIKTNIRSRLYHQIDHVIAFQPEGGPVPFIDTEKPKSVWKNDEPMEYLEDLNIPENCQLVTIILTPWQWYARNTNEILGTYSTYIETLETLPCRVVTICNTEWESLPKDSRITYLMDIINSKLESSQSEELTKCKKVLDNGEYQIVH